MHIVSVNVSLPKTVDWRGRKVATAIFKEPAKGPVRILRTGLVGDRQADPAVHGGPKKAVYAYPSEHYPFWRRELERTDLPWGSFGENLTTEGLQEDTVRIGDRLRVGSALLRVTQPRFPCYKLGIRFGRDDMVQRFLASGRSGFYLAVLKEGDVEEGDCIERLGTSVGLQTVSQVVDEVRQEEPEG
jgi:MOSC domain-containing protein YiiM